MRPLLFCKMSISAAARGWMRAELQAGLPETKNFREAFNDLSLQSSIADCRMSTATFLETSKIEIKAISSQNTGRVAHPPLTACTNTAQF